MKNNTVSRWEVIVSGGAAEREQSIADLALQMTSGEKIRQMSGSNSLFKLAVMALRYNLLTSNSGLNRRLGIPAIRFSDGPRGVAMGKSTCFPAAIARGASWDIELEERIGSAMGLEARAQGSNFLGSVCVNLLRHPGWGRAQETYSEDPYHLGEMGAAAVRGVQQNVMACVKHYACNSIEDSRFFVDVRIDERTLREIYLPHFKRCIDAGAASVMSAYNRVNGDYCPHNAHLLRDILKGEWGFDGLVISDFALGTRDTRKAALGGLDIEMPFRWHFGWKLKRAVARGSVPEKLIDEAVSRILRQKARFADEVSKAVPRDKVACREHTQLAREVSQKSIVLLRNENNALPFKRDQIKKIAVIGKLAGSPNLGDHGSSSVHPPYVVTALEGITGKAGPDIEIKYEKGNNLARVCATAAECDASIIVAGLTWRDEGEGGIPLRVKIGGDRTDLRLNKKDEALIQEVSKVAEKCIVVLVGGSAIIMESWKDKVQAVLFAWYPGMEGGNAIADIIFGDVNPSGKLPMVFPGNEGQLPPFNTKARSIGYGYYHGYRLFDKESLEPELPFGFGLSYTSYEYSNLVLSERAIGKDGSVTASVDVTNTGPMAGEEIVQLYVGYNGSNVDRPVKDLKGFSRLHLEPGETGMASFEIKAKDLAYFDASLNSWVIEEIEYTVFAGQSSKDSDLKLKETFKIS